MLYFNKEAHVKNTVLATSDAIMEAVNKISTTEAFTPSSAQANTTNQAFASVDAVVLSSYDNKKDRIPKLDLKLLIYNVHDNKSDPAMDVVNAGGIFALLATNKMDQTATGSSDKIQMPRTLNAETGMSALGYARVGIAQHPGKQNTTAASVPTGTKIRLSNVVGKLVKSERDPKGVVFVNAKSVTVIGEADDAIDGFYNLEVAMRSAYQKQYALIACPPMFGGVEGLVQTYPYLGTAIETNRKRVQTAMATQLKAKASLLDGEMAAKDTAHETPVVPSTCDIEDVAEQIDALPDGTTLSDSLASKESPLQLPILVQGLDPGATVPDAIALGMTLSKADTDAALHAQVTSVEVRGSLVKVFLKPTLALCGEEARDAIGYSHAPVTDLPGPALSYKKSLKDMAVMLDTRSQSTAEWLVRELIPRADQIAVMPVYHREIGDRVFGDYAAGVNWATSLVINLPSAIRRAGFPVSVEFAKEFSGGSDTITELDIDESDVILPPAGQEVPSKVVLRVNGYLAVNQRSTNLARLVDNRLPASKQSLTYHVVFLGSAGEKAKKNMSIQESEEALRAKFGEGDLADNLMANTVLYAIAAEHTGEGPSRKKQAV